ncbi:hypothetical protein BH09PSE6_BH09PSE6_28810 [soil metagenome]
MLAESLAINLYLARKFSCLWPASEQSQALVNQWTLWAATALEPSYVQWAMHSLWLATADRQPPLAKAASAALDRPLDRIDLHLQEHEYLVDDVFTVADLNVAGVILALTRRDNARQPAFDAWLKRCKSRPAFASAAAQP